MILDGFFTRMYVYVYVFQDICYRQLQILNVQTLVERLLKNIQISDIVNDFNV